MTEFDPAPTSDDTQRQWQTGTDTFGRVYDIVLGVTSPTAYTEIAELADCSPNAAKSTSTAWRRWASLEPIETAAQQHTNETRGISNGRTPVESQPSSLSKRSSTAWRRLNLSERNTKRSSETTDPTAVNVFDHDSHETIHERMTAISEWQGVIRDIRLYELARQLSQNDGHLIPA